MKPLLPLCLAALATAALAAPPPGHPSPAQAMDMLMPEKPPAPSELPNQGKVIGSVDANDFTYIEVERGGAAEWIAAPKMVVKPGSTIRYEDGSVMTDFYSKLLKRTFPSVMFVGHVAVMGQ
ncbi:MAG: hypothetical protein FIA96_07515 [Betaproteobacteria bacterium]|nr:hypothetical protein [Betaproteobacteria bacterium]